MDYCASHSMIQPKTTKNKIWWNRAQANTGTNTLNQWHRGTPKHISQKPRNIKLYLSSDNMLLNKRHPDPGNQCCILFNMARSHRKTYFKVSHKLRNQDQRAHRPEEATTSGRSCCKFNTYSNQGSRKQSYLTQLKKILTLLGNL